MPRRWGVEELEQLKIVFNSDSDISYTKHFPDRSPLGIRRKLIELGLIKRERWPLLKWEELEIRGYYEAGLPLGIDWLAGHLGRSIGTIANVARRMGLADKHRKRPRLANRGVAS